VLRARMPKAAVHEDDDLGRAEDDVRASSQSGQDRTVDAIAQAEAMQLPPQQQFWSGVATSLTLHPQQSISRGGFRPVHQTLANVVSYSLAIRTTMLP